MPRIAPFRGLRYDETVAGPLDALTAPPYDVISEPRRARYLDMSPYNVVHVDLAEGSGDPSAAGNRYERAAALLAAWRRDGALRLAPTAEYYAYELTWTSGEAPAGRLRGIVCALTLEPWGGGVIPHEHTMPGPVADRLELLRATRTHLSPIYGTVEGPVPALGGLLDSVCSTDPSQDLTDEEGVRHRVWEVDGATPVADWLRDEDLLIADGHHRYTTALEYRDERRAAAGPGPWDRIMAFVVDAGTERVPVLPYHRVQLTGAAPTPTTREASLDAVLRSVSDERPTVGTIVRHAETATYGRLALRGGPPAVQALHRQLLDGVAPGDALRFTHSARDAEAAVLRGDAVAAYVLPPTTTARIRAAIEHGERLPRKSTFFWPKPRTGMVFMPVS
jgi:uncharacterized protein (DUF1015 family)